jgi:ABC-2 type transport system permease protein
MTLWRLEWLRLLRTRRLLALGVVYAFFGLTGPLTARYLGQILGTLGTEGVQVLFPEPTPADGIAQFVGNASQICLLVVVLVASSALAFDARREMAVFLRTRVSSVRTIILPAYAANAAAAIAALVLGAGCAWYETAVLIGTPATGAMLAGILYGAAFLAFAVALVAGVASMVRGVLATAGTALVILLLLGIVGGLSGQSRWLPTGLLGALAELTAGAPATRFLPGLAVTLVLTAISLAAAVVLGDRREV